MKLVIMMLTTCMLSQIEKKEESVKLEVKDEKMREKKNVEEKVKARKLV